MIDSFKEINNEKKILLSKSKDVFVLYCLRFLLNIFLQIILLQYISADILGIFALFSLIFSALHTFFYFHGRSFLFSLNKEENFYKNISTVFIIDILFSLIGLFIWFYISEYIYQYKNIKVDYINYFLCLVLLNPIILLKTIFEKDLNYKLYATVNLIPIIIQIVVVLLFVYQSYIYLCLFLGKTAVVVTEAILVIYFVNNKNRFLFKFDLSIVKKYIHYGFPLLASYSFIFILQQIDKIFILHLLGTKKLGYYSVAWTISFNFLILYSALSTVLMPILSKTKDKRSMQEMLLFITKISAYVYLYIILMVNLYAVEVFKNLFQWKWIASSEPLILLTIFYCIKGIVSYWTVVFIILKKRRQIFYIDLISFIIVIILSRFAIENYGISGMAGLLLISSLITLPFIEFFVKKNIDFSYFKALKYNILLFLICYTIIEYMKNNILVSFFSFIITGVLFSVIYWFMSIIDYQKIRLCRV